MIERYVDNILIKKYNLDKKNREIYIYGLEQILSNLLNLFTSLIIGIIFNKLYKTIVYLISFVVIRIYSGGYHAKTRRKCYFLTNIITILVNLFFKYIYINNFILLHITIFSGIIIALFSPIENENKPLSNYEKNKYRKIIRIILSLLTILILILRKFNIEFISISMAVIVSMILQLTSYKIRLRGEKL